MARIRTIKPEFFTSEDTATLTPLARVFYACLWCQADREGRMKWQPRTLKVRCAPFDEIDVEPVLQELLDKHLVVLYGDGLAYIPTFTKHQIVNNRERQSELPPPLRVGREGNGKEGKGTGVKDALPRVTHASVSYSPEFLEFWARYPNKTGKGSAWKSWTRSKPALSVVLAALAWQVESKPWKEGFIPNPDTYLNQRRWEDERADAQGDQANPLSRAELEEFFR